MKSIIGVIVAIYTCKFGLPNLKQLFFINSTSFIIYRTVKSLQGTKNVSALIIIYLFIYLFDLPFNVSNKLRALKAIHKVQNTITFRL